MSSSVKNTLSPGGQVVATLVTKLTRGKAQQLGVIAVAGDVVAFTVPEPSRDHQGNIVIQVGPGNVVLGAGTFGLEVSIDGAVSWALVTGTNLAVTQANLPGSDSPALFTAQYNVSGFGAGAQFRFGFVASPTSGSAPVFAVAG